MFNQIITIEFLLSSVHGNQTERYPENLIIILPCDILKNVSRFNAIHKKYFEVQNLNICISLIFQRFWDLKWGASSRWSFGPNSAWWSIETTIIRKAHPTLIVARVHTTLQSLIRILKCFWRVPTTVVYRLQLNANL